MTRSDRRNVLPFSGKTRTKDRSAPRHATGVLKIHVLALLARWSVDLDVATGVALVLAGLGAAGHRSGFSSRTIKRRFEMAGWSSSGFVKEATVRIAAHLFAMRWRTDLVARTLGYADASAFRRFLRSARGSSVRHLRRTALEAGGRASSP
jgi:AraC-like DNA-binding protein